MTIRQFHSSLDKTHVYPLYHINSSILIAIVTSAECCDHCIFEQHGGWVVLEGVHSTLKSTTFTSILMLLLPPDLLHWQDGAPFLRQLGTSLSPHIEHQNDG